MTTKPIPRVTAQMFLATLKDGTHGWTRLCPVCGEDCNKIALVKLIYKFETCDCDKASYVHLVETLYHDACYTKRAKDESA